MDSISIVYNLDISIDTQRVSDYSRQYSMATGMVFDIKRYAIHDGPAFARQCFLKAVRWIAGGATIRRVNLRNPN
jgi:hypothetical protein